MGFIHFEIREKYFWHQYLPIIEDKFEEFQSFFGSPTVQQAILKSNKSQNIVSFVEFLFGQVMGFTLFPQNDHHIQFKYREVGKGLKYPKLDAGILHKGTLKGIIALQSPKKKDFTQMETTIAKAQLCYGINQCAIISNFCKLRFYPNYTKSHEEFDLFHMNFGRFRVLYMLLHHKTFFKGLPAILHEESLPLFNERKQIGRQGI